MGAEIRAILDVKMVSKHFWDDSGHFLDFSEIGPKWPFWGSKSRVLGPFRLILSPSIEAPKSASWQKVHLLGERGFLGHT